MAADSDTKPPFNPRDRSPTLVKLLKTRLAPVRERELIAKATCPDRPAKPAPGDCCGSSCHPCVMDNYADELRVWKECWVKWEGDGGEEILAVPRKKAGGDNETEGDEVEEKPKRKMPGAFEW
ncbi:hypothetical protein CONLIGDRAFT_685425 [Coniochaeta ligniaria NRRL 30616]|uniref:Oxidoreductase-like domain-containing protein n=1 Tax=Coniochaeta ligniaria NRRL 30616 TaxID=1408157 RepID=A0A1J7ITL6_9PEZI|nr:hypothetical protein CONLIGDRAFT_685425 [Coniochaeta ligniaria NRRL 30616]